MIVQRKCFYVLSDHRIISKRFKGVNVRCIDLRSTTQDGKKFVIASPEKDLLHRLKDVNDDYFVTHISNDILNDYCRLNDMRVMTITECHMNEKKEVCEVIINDDVL